MPIFDSLRGLLGKRWGANVNETKSNPDAVKLDNDIQLEKVKQCPFEEQNLTDNNGWLRFKQAANNGERSKDRSWRKKWITMSADHITVWWRGKPSSIDEDREKSLNNRTLTLKDCRVELTDYKRRGDVVRLSDGDSEWLLRSKSKDKLTNWRNAIQQNIISKSTSEDVQVTEENTGGTNSVQPAPETVQQDSNTALPAEDVTICHMSEPSDGDQDDRTTASLKDSDTESVPSPLTSEMNLTADACEKWDRFIKKVIDTQPQKPNKTEEAKVHFTISLPVIPETLETSIDSSTTKSVIENSSWTKSKFPRVIKLWSNQKGTCYNAPNNCVIEQPRVSFRLETAG